MAYDGWIEFNGVEIINVSRTAQLARALSIPTVRVVPGRVQWIQDALGGVDYHLIENAPWYDAGVPASAEFAGIIPLSLTGLGDSTLISTPVEFTGDGGNSGRARNETLPIVCNVLLIASTERGAEYGKRWFDRQMSVAGTGFCSGADLRYFRYAAAGAPKAHRRNVRITRGSGVIRQRKTHCSVTWTIGFTLTAADPFEYSEPMPQFTLLGGTNTAVGPGVASQGNVTTAIQQIACPVYDYSPVYDPLFPALEPPPAMPDFYPEGWSLTPGALFKRYWVRLNPVEPTTANLVPIVTLNTSVAARRVRLSIWPSDADLDEMCNPLFEVVASYLPEADTMYVDGQQQAAYLWDGGSPAVRRADSLVFTTQAEPIDWAAFNDPGGMLVTLDIFYLDGLALEGDGNVRAGLSFVAKSD